MVTELLEPIQRLTRDLRGAARTLVAAEARYLVDAYYSMQDQRIRAGNQIRALSEGKEPHEIIMWYEANAEMLEKQVKNALEAYARSSPVGQWSLSVYGIGPVIAAGLMADIDIEKAPTVGHIWSFAGQNPEAKWEKGKRRPWNARLKTLCWKMGESFKKFSGRSECFYGAVYRERKALEVARNLQGLFADQAADTLKRVPHHKQKAIYAEGRLPDGRLDMRAMRYSVKLFLSHWHHVAYETHYGKAPPKPYVISVLGHADYQGPPNWP